MEKVDLSENVAIKKKRYKKDKFQLSESQLGYVMIAPALIIILAIAIYPVLKSFWYSMFDYRLNNPTKNETFLGYKLNMEKYFSNIDEATYAFEQAEGSAKGEVKRILKVDYNKLVADNRAIRKIDNVASKEKKLRKFTDSYLPVTDKNLQYVNIDRKLAKELHNDFVKMRIELGKLKVDKNIKNDISKVTGLLEEIRDSFVTPNFVGLDNYTYYLNPKNNDFWDAIGYTFTFTLISVFF